MKMIKMMMVMMVMGVTFGSNVEKTCKQTTDYNLCVSLLRSDPRSSSADTVGLGLILVDKIKALGTKTIAHIKDTYKTKPMLKHALDECNEDYLTIVKYDVQSAIATITGNPKFAEEAVVDAGLEAYSCEREFGKGQNPFINLTQQMRKICDVARDIIRILL